jgi:hypothetical protein
MEQFVLYFHTFNEVQCILSLVACSESYEGFRVGDLAVSKVGGLYLLRQKAHQALKCDVIRKVAHKYVLRRNIRRVVLHFVRDGPVDC